MARWFPLLAAALVGACVHGTGGAPGQPGATPIKVEVTSAHALSVDLYIYGRGTSRRLGTVHPGIPSHFELPQAYLSSGGVIEFEVRAPSGERYQSGEILLAPGDVVEIAIHPRLFNTVTTVRP